jgi:hypothetical protein
MESVWGQVFRVALPFWRSLAMVWVEPEPAVVHETKLRQVMAERESAHLPSQLVRRQSRLMLVVVSRANRPSRRHELLASTVDLAQAIQTDRRPYVSRKVP